MGSLFANLPPLSMVEVQAKSLVFIHNATSSCASPRRIMFSGTTSPGAYARLFKALCIDHRIDGQFPGPWLSGRYIYPVRMRYLIPAFPVYHTFVR